MYDAGTKPREFGIYDVLNKADGLVSLTAHMVLSAKYTISEWYCPSALTLCARVGLSHSGAPTRALRSSFRAHFDTPPHFVCSPSLAAKCFTLADGKALVSESATMSSVGQ